MTDTTMIVDRQLVADTMICALAAHIDTEDFVGVGLGTPLALAAVLLARATHAPTAHVLAGGAFDADADLATYLGGSRALVGHTGGFVSHFDSMDMAERQTMTLQFLRPAQIDRSGNLNTSRIGPLDRPSVRFPGGLATGDVPSLLPRVVAYLPDQRSRNVVEGVSYRTGPGVGRTAGRFVAKGVQALVTDLACFSFEEGNVTVSSVHPWVERRDLLERTGFEVDAPDPLPRTPLPSSEQTKVLESLDRDGIRQREIRNVPAKERG